MDNKAMYKISYGLYILTAKDGEKDNGCVINTMGQVTSSPNRISVTVNKANLTHDMILKTGRFNVSILTTSTPFEAIEHFGFNSGKDINKFENVCETKRSENGLCYIPEHTNSYISGSVTEKIDLGTHTMFIAEVTQAEVLSDEASLTYEYYQNNIKPKPAPSSGTKVAYRCRICGYIYEGEIPDDFICPLCKHPASDFERIEISG